MADKQISLVTVPTSMESRRLARYLSVVSRRPVHAIVTDGLQLLKAQLGVDDPPEVRKQTTEPAE